MSDRDGSSFVWFLAGLGLGALVGVLYAPRSGSETREELRARAEQGRDYVKTRAREARDQAIVGCAQAVHHAVFIARVLDGGDDRKTSFPFANHFHE